MRILVSDWLHGNTRVLSGNAHDGSTIQSHLATKDERLDCCDETFTGFQGLGHSLIVFICVDSVYFVAVTVVKT